MELLPPDVFDAVCAGVTGFELFQLSHVNSKLFHLLSAEHHWRRFFLDGDFDADTAVSGGAAKRRYILARSVQFDGRPTPEQRHIDAAVTNKFVRVTSFTRDFGPRRKEFVTIDTWFSLLPDDDKVHTGGVMFGAQSWDAGEDYWPDYHQQFIFVDADRNLYCSLLTRRNFSSERVAIDLTPQRWYHLALTYDGDTRVQQVFLDGNLVDSRVGDWHHEWWNLRTAQIGTGCITAGNNRFPVAGHIGWYGFHGIIDEFRVWYGVKTEQQIQLMATNTSLPDRCDLWFDLSACTHTAEEERIPRYVSCARPCERWCRSVVQRNRELEH